MNHEPKKECFKTSVGGQALMEGIMMRGPKQICCAVRKPDGTIETKIEDTPKHGIWAKIPIVRGAISMIESLITGYRYMMYSAHHHTHEGSIGNLCNAEISALMQQVIDGFNFCGMERAEKALLGR